VEGFYTVSCVLVRVQCGVNTGSNPVLTTNLNKTKTMEQKFIIADRDYEINELLQDGWRVVSITSQRVATGGTSTSYGGFVILLERPKQ
jgi:hypothetical protein